MNVHTPQIYSKTLIVFQMKSASLSYIQKFLLLNSMRVKQKDSVLLKTFNKCLSLIKMLVLPKLLVIAMCQNHLQKETRENIMPGIFKHKN